MLVALRFPRPPWLIPPSHFLYFPFINLVGDINCRNLTYISCLHGKLSFHIKCSTQKQAAESDELENLFPHFSFFSLRPFIIFLLTKQKSLTIHTNLRRFCQIISKYLAWLRKFKDVHLKYETNGIFGRSTLLDSITHDDHKLSSGDIISTPPSLTAANSLSPRSFMP